MAKITQLATRNAPPPAVNPGQPPKFTPGTTSPLDRTARDFASRIAVQSAQEQRRAEALSDQIRSGEKAPRYGDAVTRPPFTPTTPVPVDPAPGEKAGGSKS